MLRQIEFINSIYKYTSLTVSFIHTMNTPLHYNINNSRFSSNNFQSRNFNASSYSNRYVSAQQSHAIITPPTVRLYAVDRYIVPNGVVQSVRPVVTSSSPLIRYAVQVSSTPRTDKAITQSSSSRKRKSDSSFSVNSTEGSTSAKSSKSLPENIDEDESPLKFQAIHQPDENINQQPQFSSPSNSLLSVEGDKMTAFIMSYMDDNRQQEDLYTQKMRLRDALYAIIKNIYPHSGLYVVGSSVNDFGSNESDMDLCLMLTNDEIDRSQSAQILHILKSTLHKCRFLEKLLVINAKVPILKFNDKVSQLSCDLNINNAVGIRNTHLLKMYAKMDRRVVPLVLFVKYWAKMQGINDASQATISSYSFALMVIHYLQCGCKPAVVPCLQTTYPHLFDPEMDIRSLSLNESLQMYKSNNHKSVGELFLGFLHYYTHEFDFDSDVVCVRLGKRLRRRDVVKLCKGAPTDEWKFICIEEPFNLTNTARAVYDANIYNRILRVFRESYKQLRKTGDLQSILDHPY